MHYRFTRALFLVAFLLVENVPSLFAASDEIRKYMANRVEESKRAVGMAVGVISASEREVFVKGKLAKDRPDEVGGNTIFEIGSTTKLFTSLLLADMIERGEVKPDTPVASLLPEGVKVPERDGKKITLLDLSMHVSGLPRMPSNLAPKDLGNIYSGYTPAMLYSFLSSYKLPRDIGEQYEYSNLGAGLLGHALALKAGLSYEELLRKRILEPLEMTNTGITLTEEQQSRFASGYDPALDPARHWDFDALAGCCALRSTAIDMLKFMAAVLEISDTPLKAAAHRMLAERRSTGTKDLDIMMAWHVLNKFDTEAVVNSGNTAGFWTFVGFDPAKKYGVVVLCNTYLDIDDIGLHALMGKWPIKPLDPLPKRYEIKVDPKILESYVGEYRVHQGLVFKVTTENGRLFAETNSQPRFELFASTNVEFFLKIMDARLAFSKDRQGTVTGLVLDQNGKRTAAAKIK